MTDARFTPIEEYGLVGNLETCALVAPNGSTDLRTVDRGCVIEESEI